MKLVRVKLVEGWDAWISPEHVTVIMPQFDKNNRPVVGNAVIGTIGGPVIVIGVAKELAILLGASGLES